MGSEQASLLVCLVTFQLLVRLKNSHPLDLLILTRVSTTLCLLHRAHMPPATTNKPGQVQGFSDDAAYPSRTIAFQAAAMITSIIEALQAHDELRFTPAFM